jgi:uncharacterized protein
MIHTYRLGGYNIAIDVNSGAIHSLSDAAYDVLENITEIRGCCPESVLNNPNLNKYSILEISEAYSELKKLHAEGMLFSDDDYLDINKAIPDSFPLKALCLHVSHDCNLRCEYCFASTGDFGAGRKLMPESIARAAIDYVIARSGSRRNIEIDFFGGEPLMNFDVVKSTVEYAKKQGGLHDKVFRFTLTTNGVLLNDGISDYINENMDNIVLSLDGRREINDCFRKTVNGKGSYDTILPKFKYLTDNRDTSRDYYLRGTFTNKNPDFINDVLHLAGLGFSELSLEPVVAKPDMKYALSEADLPAIFAEYEELAEIMKDRDDFRFFHFTVDLNQGPCVIKRVRGCGAGYEYAAVSPEGHVYPCHQFVGMPEFIMGNVSDDSFDESVSEKFIGQNIFTREKCGECWAKYYCSGGCGAANYNINGDLNIPYELGCRLEKKRLECAIMLKVHKFMKSS